jgi:aryl-phospho-beta-D-glucosidase BglC (GH1 family)
MKKSKVYYFFFCSILISLTIGVIAQRSNTAARSKHPKNTFDPGLSAKEYPSPSIVRGFMMKEKNAQKDYDDARAFGANVIRLQLHPARYATNKKEEFWVAWPSYLDQMESQVKQARQAGLKVVIDLHEPPFQRVNLERPELWNKDNLADSFCRVWNDIAIRLLPYREAIWGYDLYNEPLDRTQLPNPPRQWRPLAIKILNAIRKVDKQTWIIYEAGPGSLVGGFKELEPLPDARIIYSPHFYYPQSFTHQGVFDIKGTDLAEAMKEINISYPSIIDGVQWNKRYLNEILKDVDEFQARWKVPIYVGEFSVIRWSPKDASVQWLRDVVDLFESRGWSWTYHAFREFHGWSLEHDGEFWMKGMPAPIPAPNETDRAKVIKKTFEKNWPVRSTTLR